MNIKDDTTTADNRSAANKEDGMTRSRTKSAPATRANKEIATAAKVIAETIEHIDNRCMAADGPVTPTLEEATADELRTIYQACKRIQAAV